MKASLREIEVHEYDEFMLRHPIKMLSVNHVTLRKTLLWKIILNTH